MVILDLYIFFRQDDGKHCFLKFSALNKLWRLCIHGFEKKSYWPDCPKWPKIENSCWKCVSRHICLVIYDLAFECKLNCRVITGKGYLLKRSVSGGRRNRRKARIMAVSDKWNRLVKSDPKKGEVEPSSCIHESAIELRFRQISLKYLFSRY